MKWEYEVLFLGTPEPGSYLVANRLNELGRDSWELVAVVKNKWGYFKRPVKEQLEWIRSYSVDMPCDEDITVTCVGKPCDNLEEECCD